MSLDLHNDHNVYILGAGFSADAGMPLVKDFLVVMRDSHDWLLQQDRKPEADAVEKVLKFRSRATTAAYWVNLDLENIEELFSLASANGGEMNDQIRRAISATLDFAEKREGKWRASLFFRGESNIFMPLEKKHPRWLSLNPEIKAEAQQGHYNGNLYSAITATLLGLFSKEKPKRKNTFLTFNYDTLLEEALLDLGMPFHYGFSSNNVEFDANCPGNTEGGLSVLKLHGSVNWGRADSNSLRVFKSYDGVRDSGLVPELLPPTWKKVFQTQLESVWERAVKTLNTATRIIVIGFSVPPTDVHFKYLMAAGLQENISLREILFVNSAPKADMEAKARTLLRPSYFENHLIRVQQESVHSFCNNNVDLSSIGRPIEEGVSVQFQKQWRQ